MIKMDKVLSAMSMVNIRTTISVLKARIGICRERRRPLGRCFGEEKHIQLICFINV